MPDNSDRESAVLFGKVTANISHEIKNSLAIIKEIAGLQGDLLLAAEQGRTLDPARMKSLADRIVKQVEKADLVVKRMNRFAHTVDLCKKTVDIGEEIRFIIVLIDRLFQMRGVLLHAHVPSDPVQVETDPFRLVSAVITCMQIFLDCLGKGRELNIHVQPHEGGAMLGFDAGEDDPELPPTCQATIQCALQGMGAEVLVPGNTYSMELIIPALMAA
ncbi:histidine kinase A domain-containing protein [Desulfatibacillum aliphaticivorans]|uniref:histidine kinase n=1 Tax=Desulfatibacillum aliphaticivorans TaxID=218208 RepID=B8FKZ0_DESAL|nr:histidine kinase A domain-containing protein [Desulfatibacillum aliphaticivorans]ACL04625.1 histidine kinase A domain-containing protein [Desulfatibacillum aliphaticivorans]